MADAVEAPAQPDGPTAGPGQTSSPLARSAAPAVLDLNALLQQMESLNKLKAVYQSMLARAQAEEQGPPTMYTANDIPSMIESLGSNKADEFNKGAQALDSIGRRQPELLKSDILPIIPYIISVLPAFPDPGRPSTIINLLHNFRFACPEALDAVDANVNLEEAMTMLKKWKPEAIEARKAWFRLLEKMLIKDRPDDGAKSHGTVEKELVPVLRTHFYTFGREDEIVDDKGKGKADAKQSGDWNINEAFNVIKMLEIVSGDRSYIYLRRALFKGGALEFLIRVATTSSHHPSLLPSALVDPDDGAPQEITITSLRLEAVSLLAQLYQHIVKETLNPKDFPHLSYTPDAKFDLQGRILMPLLDIINDEDIAVSDEVADLMCERFNDPDKAVEVYLWTHEGSMERLVHKLALSGGKKGKGQNRLEKWAMMQSMGVDPMQMLGLSLAEGQAAQQQEEVQASASALGDSQKEPGEAKSEQDASASAVIGKQKDDEIAQTEQQRDDESAQNKQQAIRCDTGDNQNDGGGEKDQQTPALDGQQLECEEKQGQLEESEPSEVQHETVVDESKRSDSEEGQGEQQGSAARKSDSQIEHDVHGSPSKQQPSAVLEASKPQQQETIPTQHSAVTMAVSQARHDFLKMLEWADSHSQAEWLLSRALKRNPEGGVDAFGSFWSRRDVSGQARHELLRVLSTAFKPVMQAAVDAGLPVPEMVQESMPRKEVVQSTEEGVPGEMIAVRNTAEEPEARANSG